MSFFAIAEMAPDPRGFSLPPSTGAPSSPLDSAPPSPAGRGTTITPNSTPPRHPPAKSAPSTPNQTTASPAKQSPNKTPKDWTKFQSNLEDMDVGADIMKSERQAMDAAIASLRHLTPAKGKELAQRAVKHVLGKNSPKSNNAAVEHLSVPDSWTAELCASLNRATGIAARAINFKHLEAPQGRTGFHFCPTPARAGLVNIRTNAANGVFIADFGTPPRMKQSSFFPLTITTQDQLHQVITSSEEVARTENTRLYRTTVGTPIYLTLFLKAGGTVVQSCFPIFFVGDLDTATADISIAGRATIRKNDWIARLASMSWIELENLIQFRTGTAAAGRLFLDLAGPLERAGVQTAGIQQGICFWVNTATLRAQT